MIPALYYDGKSAASREVMVEVGRGNLIVADRTAAGEIGAVLELEHLSIEIRPDRSIVARTKSGERVVFRPEAREWLKRTGLVKRRISLLSGEWSFAKIVSTACGGIALLIGGAWLLPTAAASFITIVPTSFDRALGDEVMKTVAREFGEECQDGGARRAIQRLVKDVLREHPEPLAVSVSVRDSKIVNAFATPGTHFVVLGGIIHQTKSGDQLAGVIAHELGHLVARHTMKQALNTLGRNALTLYFRHQLGEVGGGALGLSAQAFSLAFSREQEHEADMLGVELLTRAGFSSQGMADFFDELLRTQGNGERGLLATFGSTHPTHRERLLRLRPLVQSGRAPFSEEEWGEILRCGG